MCKYSINVETIHPFRLILLLEEDEETGNYLDGRVSNVYKSGVITAVHYKFDLSVLLKGYAFMLPT